MDKLSYEIVNIIKEYVSFRPKNKEELQEAVDLWCSKRKKAKKKYKQHISFWDTSLITNMSNLFFNKRNFNENINNWNVSNVTNMEKMFCHAYSFNQP